MIYTVKISHPGLEAEAIHYSSMPYSWLVHVMEAPSRPEALKRWFRFLNIALMDSSAQKKLHTLNMKEFEEVLSQYLVNDILVNNWELQG